MGRSSHIVNLLSYGLTDLGVETLRDMRFPLGWSEEVSAVSLEDPDEIKLEYSGLNCRLVLLTLVNDAEEGGDPSMERLWNMVPKAPEHAFRHAATYLLKLGCLVRT